MQTTSKLVNNICVSCSLCLILSLLTGCGGGNSNSLTSTERYIADQLIKKHGQNAILRYLETLPYLGTSDNAPEKVLLHLEYFVSKGANDFNAKNNSGDTPLHLASVSGSVEVIALLVANGADVNTKNKYGDTPFGVAKKNGNMDVMKYLSGMDQTDPAAAEERKKQQQEQAAAEAARERERQVREASERRDKEAVAEARKKTLRETMIVVGICGGIALIVLIVWAVVRQNSKCPLCRQAWGKTIVSDTLIDQINEIRNTISTTYVTNSQGESLGAVHRPTQKIVTVNTHLVECRCKHCGHEWSYTYTTET